MNPVRGVRGATRARKRPKITQNALHTAPGGQILSFLTFWTYRWALGAHSSGTQQIRDLADEAPKGPQMT